MLTKELMLKGISSNISRLGLHDSSFEAIIRRGDEIEITFDWSKLENYFEQGISEHIIIGKTNMFLKGVSSEEFKVYDDNEAKFETIPFPNDIIECSEQIGTNEVNDETQKINIGWLYRNAGELKWVEWSFKFDTCKISWNSHITNTEWSSGKLPAD